VTIKARFIKSIVQYPYWYLLVNLALILAIGAGTVRLGVETGIDIFFAKDDPNLLAERALQRIYGREDNILFIIDAGSGDIFDRANLATLKHITDAAWQIPHSRRVDSVINFLHPEVDGDDIRIDPLVSDVEPLGEEDLRRIRTTALAQDSIVGRLLARNGQVAAVSVNLSLPAEEKAAAIAESVRFARDAAAEAVKSNPALEIHLAGWALNEQTLADITAADSKTLMPALLLIVLVVNALILRSVLASLCIVICIFLSIMAGMGYAGWVGIGLNSVNVSAPTIILTLAIADCIHMLSVYLVQLRGGAEKRAALTACLDQTIYAVILTSVTTALGFLTMNFSDSPPFRELGNIAAVGVVAALWATLTILPGLMLLCPFKLGGQTRTGFNLDGLGEFVIRRYKPIFWGSLLLSALAISFIPRIELNDDPTGYFSDNVPLSRAIEVIETRLSGTQTLHYSFDAGQPDGIMDPAFLTMVDQFVLWLRAQPEVVNVESFTDTLKRLNQVMHADEESWHRLPEQKDLTAQYVILYEISTPYGQEVTHLISADKSSLKVTATLTNQKSQGLLDFEERSRLWLNEHHPGSSVRGAGQSISFANVGLRNIESMLSGSIVAIVLICLCMVIAFRSIRYGLLSFLPNLLPALVTFGIWGALVGEVNIAASVVFSLTLGIVVDDTTHFLIKYLKARKEDGLCAKDAVRYTYHAVGSALLSTSVVLAIGFLVLVLSDFSVNSTSGLLVAITIAVAILLDLLFLPALLIKADRWLVPQRSLQISS
jgi:predicted RND superfamily exporter protein